MKFLKIRSGDFCMNKKADFKFCEENLKISLCFGKF